MEPNYTVTKSNIHIFDSYTVKKKNFPSTLNVIRKVYPTYDVVVHRNNFLMCLEWAAHNLLYNLHILRDHTKDVDLNYPQKWYIKILYFIAGGLSWFFIP